MELQLWRNLLAKVYDSGKVQNIANYAHMYVFEWNGKIVGTGSISSFWGSKTESILLTIFVLPELHGKGIGREIINTLEQDEFYVRAKMKNMDFSRYPFNAYDEYHFYIENYGNEVVDLEFFVEIFKKIGDNLSCIARYYEEMATFVPDYD